MFLEIGLLIVGSVAIVGLIYRAFEWFNLRIGPDAGSVSRIGRLADFLKQLPRTFFSWKFIKRLVLDVLLQTRLLRESPLRWLAHICIAYGFMALLLTHALDGYVTAKLVSDYEVTLNPWLALRNVFGALVILGVFISLWQRHFSRGLPVKSKGMDRRALIILMLIMVSGFLLEGAKIISTNVFYEMADEYAWMDDPEELRPLKAYWVEYYGAAFDDLSGPFEEDTLMEGEEMNEEYCSFCHSRPQAAFVSYGLSRAMLPLNNWLDRVNADVLFWYFHVIICLAGLALLPFTKFLHMVTSPLTLLIDRPGKKQYSPEYLANARALTLDACTHCGLCSEHCSVAPVYRVIGNENVLPSEKLQGLKALLKGRRLKDKVQYSIREGSYICTGCYRCTQVCPVGLNLQDLWAASQGELATRRLAAPVILARENGQELLEDFKRNNGKVIKLNSKANGAFRDLSRSNTMTQCFACMTCSCSCPVVQQYGENPRAEVDLLPHEVIRSVALGQPDLALNARMLWDCMNCYMCQENCPQGVKVCDIMYELKNMAYSRLAEKNNGVGKD